MEVRVIYWIVCGVILLLASASIAARKGGRKNPAALRKALRILSCAGVLCIAISGILAIGGRGTPPKEISATEAPEQMDAAEPTSTTDAEATALANAQPLRIDGTADDAPVLNGATALGPVYEAFMEKVYEPLPEDRSKLLYVDTTPAAYEALLNRTADVIFVADPSDEQRAEAERLGLEMVFTPFAREAFVFFVDNHNYIGNLTAQQVRDIYSGKITDWSEVGGDAGAITAYQRNEGSGSQSMMLRFMGDAPLMDAPTETINAMGMIITEVSEYQEGGGSIGYSFRYYFTEMVGNDQTHMLNLDGVAPTVENIQNGSYPALTTVYAVYLADNENPLARRLCEWTTSDEAKAIVEQIGYVPYASPAV